MVFPFHLISEAAPEIPKQREGSLLEVNRRLFVHMGIGSIISLSGCEGLFQDKKDGGRETTTPRSMTPFDATAPDSFPESDRKELERRIHEQVNNERQDHGLNPLDFNENLAYIARTHSRDMAVNDYFAHEEPDGDGPVERLEEFGYESDHTSENIAKPSTSPNVSLSVIAKRTVRLWMASPSHREQILVPSYLLEGVGVYVENHYSIYITQIFDG